MSAALLDVNVLLALSWSNHVYAGIARNWFARNARHGWATCLLTEASFVRLSAQPSVVGISISPADAIRALARNCTSPSHVYWPEAPSLREILPEIRDRIAGHRQISDALLLDLAIRKGGTVVTFDQKVRALLAPASPHHRALETLN